VNRVVREIERRGGGVIRWMVSGDIFSAAFAKKLLAVVRRTPGVRHFLYTRSWRVASIRPVLLALAAESNCRVWFSADKESGVPFPIPQGVRVAYMMADASEAETCADLVRASHLVFRVRHRRAAPAVKICGVPVCPVESNTSAGHQTTCGTCGICWKGGAK
jgi:hypothetical protein